MVLLPDPTHSLQTFAELVPDAVLTVHTMHCAGASCLHVDPWHQPFNVASFVVKISHRVQLDAPMKVCDWRHWFTCVGICRLQRPSLWHHHPLNFVALPDPTHAEPMITLPEVLLEGQIIQSAEGSHLH